MKSLFPICNLSRAIVRLALMRSSCLLLLQMLIAALVFTPASSAMAAWNNGAETIQEHPTHIYTPSSTMSTGKHGLLIVLHGCAQTHDEIKGFGNLEPAADRNALVVAVPYVTPQDAWPGNPSARCWAYDGAQNIKGHIVEIVNLARTLMARGNLKIDPKHVYVVGLSSGAALALDVACKAPDIFAGVGAIAGPSVGSNQKQALDRRGNIPSTNVDNAVSTCKSLAGSKASALNTQIANIAFGDMDLDGPNERFWFRNLPQIDQPNHAGQIALVSVQWSEDNVKVLQRLYGTDPLGSSTSVQGSFGTAQVAMKDGKQRVVRLVMHNIGHAWAAGTGRPNSPPPDGIWIAQSGLNYPDYIAGWLTANNMRVSSQAGLEVTANASANGKKVSVSGTVKNPDGSSANSNVRVDTSLLDSVSNQQIINHGGIATNSGAYSDVFDNLANGTYKVQVTATDSTNNKSGIMVSNEVRVGSPSPPPRCFTDNNFNHVQKGRALPCSSGFACAKGSGDNLGFLSSFVTSSVVEDSPGFFKKGMCSGQ